MPTFPEWWNWDLSFTSHAELRMEQRGVTEIDVRAMLERATGFDPNVVEGRFMMHVRHLQQPWIVIVESQYRSPYKCFGTVSRTVTFELLIRSTTAVSELMANSKLRFEEFARRILQRELARPVVLNDDGRENGLVDLCEGDVQSPLIAIDCTAAVDPVRTETWNLGPGRDKLKFDLAHDWYVVIKPQTRVTELRHRLGGLLRNCETAGIERFAEGDFGLTRQHSSISEALASLEVDSIHAFREAGSGFVYLTMTGLGGAVDPTATIAIPAAQARTLDAIAFPSSSMEAGKRLERGQTAKLP